MKTMACRHNKLTSLKCWKPGKIDKNNNKKQQQKQKPRIVYKILCFGGSRCRNVLLFQVGDDFRSFVNRRKISIIFNKLFSCLYYYVPESTLKLRPNIRGVSRRSHTRGPSESSILTLWSKVEEYHPPPSIWHPWSILPWSPCLCLNGKGRAKNLKKKEKQVVVKGVKFGIKKLPKFFLTMFKILNKALQF